MVGKGAFSTVYLSYSVRSRNKPLAIKVIDMKLQGLPEIRDEIKIMKQLNSPHIVKIYDAFISKSFLKADQDFPSGYIVMEYCGSDLMRQKHLPIESKLKLVSQLLKGLNFLHQNELYHEDLKPQNILV